MKKLIYIFLLTLPACSTLEFRRAYECRIYGWDTIKATVTVEASNREDAEAIVRDLYVEMQPTSIECN